MRPRTRLATEGEDWARKWGGVGLFLNAREAKKGLNRDDKGRYWGLEKR